MKRRTTKSISAEHKTIVTGAKTGLTDFHAKRLAVANNDLVKESWSVKYDPLGHDVLIEARVKVANSKDSLLQVWLGDYAPGIWIPEVQPWISSVVEFEPEERIKSAHVGLIDSKWRKEDIGLEYLFVLSGYVLHAGKAESFRFEKKFIYPG